MIVQQDLPSKEPKERKGLNFFHSFLLSFRLLCRVAERVVCNKCVGSLQCFSSTKTPTSFDQRLFPCPKSNALPMGLSYRLRHRGPDWSGVKLHKNNVLAHERLAIVGLGNSAKHSSQTLGHNL